MATAPRISIPDRLTFVANLDLPEIPERFPALRYRGPEAAVGQQAAFVNAGSIISFVAGVSGQARSDLLNSTMLAQLAADKQCDREEQTEQWYKRYKSILENVGWVIQDFSFAKYTADGNKLDVDKAILTILAAVATGAGELLAIKAAIDAARSLADGDGRLTLFDHFSAKKQVGSFQIGVASETNGAIAFKLGAFRLECQTNLTKVLWFEFARQSTSIYQGTQSATLNTNVYEKVRSTIEEKLGERAKGFLGSLEV